MNKEETNRLLKLKRVINENDDKYVESFRETYSKITKYLKIHRKIYIFHISPSFR